MKKENFKSYEEPRAEFFRFTLEGVLCSSGGSGGTLPDVPPGGIEGVEDDGEL
ncbi:MAG: hypothetical protein ACI395_07090 [Candidatus Cryptobacteroides sp.]